MREIPCHGRSTLILCLAASAALLAACPEARVSPYTERREPCADHNPEKNVYYGDLHVHASYSFDAYGYDVRVTPHDVYRFAKGESLGLAPHDANGDASRMAQLERPLDFVMASEHAEFLGETYVCTTPGAVGYDSAFCASFRLGGEDAVTLTAFATSFTNPQRHNICPTPGDDTCIYDGLRVRWEEIQRAAEQAYDRSAQCSFVSFIGYEYTGTPDIANHHRTVLFRNDKVIDLPISYFEQPTPYGLWTELERQCLGAGTGCDVMTIAHNSNLSNGHLFALEYGSARTVDEEAMAADLRARMEPVVEMFQHKGDMECRNGLAGTNGDPDPLCDFEKLREEPLDDCGDGTGTGGMRLGGCVSRLDFVRGILKAGMQEAERLGVNPYQLGVIATTDTHNGTPGMVAEYAFPGHVGVVDDSPVKRLGSGTLTHDALINNPGGLTAVWAEERSRDAIFTALRRREVFATSGPRLAVRFFGGWDYPDTWCGDLDRVAQGYAGGVPMGQDLPLRAAGAAGPVFAVWAAADPGTAAHPGTPLQRIQIIKGWLDASGAAWEKVFEVAGDGQNGATVDLGTCLPLGTGDETLCAVWRDPEFDPARRAFYYARVVENPTCRWSTWECLRLPQDERPVVCADLPVPIIQERAWTSAIWYVP